MNTFIFQAVPDRYDLRLELHPGKPDTWYATRYRNDMKAGDVVFFWLGGDQGSRGLYGWGTLTSGAYMKSEWDSHGVDVHYNVRFTKPILATDLKKEPSLKDLLIFRAPQATNFLLTEQQASALRAFVRRNDEEAPPQESQS